MPHSSVVIGNFDGVHLGHQSVLEAAKRAGGDDDLVVVTFWPHPLRILHPEIAPLLLQTLNDRIDALKAVGVDQVRVVEFTSRVREWSPETFVEHVIEPLNPARIMVGENFRFGKGGVGDGDTLRALSGGRYDVQTIDLKMTGGQRTSSTLIRGLLAQGDVAGAREQLGRPFRTRGVVIVGDQRGRTLGFPTANLAIPRGYAVPADGVYSGWLTRVDQPDEVMAAAISVGTNPTFDGPQRRVESYVIDRDDLDLYGLEIVVDYASRLRGQIKFTSADELVAQMNLDVQRVREELNA